MIKAHIVCAALKRNHDIIVGVRHFDKLMHLQIDKLKKLQAIEAVICENETGCEVVWEQGFIDQFGKFYTRKEAMQIVKDNGQPFNIDRNGGNGAELCSEGLY